MEQVYLDLRIWYTSCTLHLKITLIHYLFMFLAWGISILNTHVIFYFWCCYNSHLDWIQLGNAMWYLVIFGDRSHPPKHIHGHNILCLQSESYNAHINMSNHKDSVLTQCEDDQSYVIYGGIEWLLIPLSN